MFLKKYKLYNLIKGEIHILTTTTIKKIKNKKKTHKYIKFTIAFYEFHILKLMHNSLIINATSYISFNVYNQAIIHPLNVEQIMEQNLILLV